MAHTLKPSLASCVAATQSDVLYDINLLRSKHENNSNKKKKNKLINKRRSDGFGFNPDNALVQ